MSDSIGTIVILVFSVKNNFFSKSYIDQKYVVISLLLFFIIKLYKLNMRKKKSLPITKIKGRVIFIPIEVGIGTAVSSLIFYGNYAIKK